MAKKLKNETKSASGRRWYRDAATGRFVTKKYAKKHRETTARAW
jgi:predicted transcriptional regulator